jgi:aryl-alcohol dehydrogenase-like predicted oxidoreductase
MTLLQQPQLMRTIPSTGVRIPAIGLGTTTSFAQATRIFDQHVQLREVLKRFHEAGGRVIDAMPGYEDAERVLARLAGEAGKREDVFWASKVSVRASGGRDAGQLQVDQSLARLGHIDLLQIHDLFRWQAQLPLLRDLKRQGRIRYVGVTVSSELLHAELEPVLRTEQLDFVQLDYAIDRRASERTLIPLARDRGIAVLVNGPFGRGRLFERVAGRPVPAWAGEFGARSWSQFFLKWVLGHDAVTGVLPSTSNPEHLRDNMGAGVGRVPSATERTRMTQLIDELPGG